MHIISLVWGILSIVGMLVAFIPCLGSLNWLNIPFAGIGLIIAAIAMNSADSQSEKSSAKTGLYLCGIAIFFGLMRLVLGGGVL